MPELSCVLNKYGQLNIFLCHQLRYMYIIIWKDFFVDYRRENSFSALMNTRKESIFSSYPKSSSHFLSAILVSLIEIRRSSIESCFRRKKNLIIIVQPISSVCARDREDKKKKKSRSLPFFFLSDIIVKWKCFLPGIGLFLSFSR